MNPKLSTLALLGAALLTASAAQAQTAGTLSARLGAM